MFTKEIIKVVSCVMLVGCLFEMPYGYYQFVRIVIFVLFIFLAWEYNRSKSSWTVLSCILIAILFNPIFKIYFRKEFWQKVDIAVASVLIFWVIIEIASFTMKKNRKKVVNS